MSRWILKMSSCGSCADMETSAPLINAVVNNALFQSNSRINQILPQIIHILRFFFWQTRCPIFWNKCIEVKAVKMTEIWKFIQVFCIIALLDWEQRMMHRRSGQTQLAEKITTSRSYQKWQCDIAAYITKLRQMPEDTIIQFISLWQTDCNWC